MRDSFFLCHIPSPDEMLRPQSHARFRLLVNPSFPDSRKRACLGWLAPSREGIWPIGHPFPPRTRILSGVGLKWKGSLLGKLTRCILLSF